MNRFGNVYGMSWLPGIATQRQPEPAEEVGRPLVLAAQPTVGEIAARDHELRPRLLDQPAERFDRLRPVVPAEVQVGDVENTCRHGRMRLYSPTMADTGSDTESGNDSPEIFDDLYLGLRAGGALRKQRRGEPLTTEEQEALGRWNRLSIGAEDGRRRRVRARHLRPRLHPRRPDLRPLAQGLT